MGKTYVSAIAEVEKCVAAFRYYAEQGPQHLKTKPVQIGSCRLRGERGAQVKPVRSAPAGSRLPSGVWFCFPLRVRHPVRGRRLLIYAKFIGIRFMRLFAGEAAMRRMPKT